MVLFGARTLSRSPSRLSRRYLALGLAGLALLVGLSLLDLLLGVPRVPASEVARALTGGGSDLARVVVLELRLPRLVLAILAGSMLALSGTLLQDTLRNPLAGPELIGVSASATIVVAAITILHLSVPLASVPWLALAGGLLGGGLVLIAASRMRDPVRMILIGAALTALMNAGVILLMSYGTQNDVSILFLFLVGSLANRTWIHVQILAPWAVICIPLALLLARPLNVLQLGDDTARGLGLPLRQVRAVVLILAAALVAGVVALCGPLAFIALLAPHLARQLLRTRDARVALPAAALLGALLLTGADMLARITFDPLELPVGVLTTVLGGPALLLLLRRRIGARWGSARRSVG
jgi:iron complex transport system permease protein